MKMLPGSALTSLLPSSRERDIISILDKLCQVYFSTDLQAIASACGDMSSVTPSSQKLPVISVGYVRPRTRKMESCTSLVSGPVQKLRVIKCQGVVPTVVSLITLGPLEWIGSTTWRRGPLSEVMSCERT